MAPAAYKERSQDVGAPAQPPLGKRARETTAELLQPSTIVCGQQTVA